MCVCVFCFFKIAQEKVKIILILFNAKDQDLITPKVYHNMTIPQWVLHKFKNSQSSFINKLSSYQIIKLISQFTKINQSSFHWQVIKFIANSFHNLPKSNQKIVVSIAQRT